MNFEEMEKEFNQLMKHGQELIEKLKQEREPVKKVTEEDIGKLCKFWDDEACIQAVGLLERLNPREETSLKYRMKNGFDFGHCLRLTPAEVAEITGYKVEALK
jgi:hypothetical protein